MKKVSKTLIFTTMLAGLFLQACTKDPVEQNSEIRLSQDTVEVPQEGGRFTQTYSILNPSDAFEMSASCPETWVTDLDVSIDNVLTFTVQANPNEQVREAVITLEYGQAQASLTVRQQAYEPDPSEGPAFEISVSDIDIETAISTIVPKDESMTYAAMCMPAEDFAGYGSDDKVYEALVDYYWSVATDMGLPVSDFLKTYVLLQGEQTKRINGLYPGVEYHVLAVGMDEKAKQTSAMVNAKFQAKPIEMNGATFDLSYDIDGMSVVMNVKPSSNDIYYYYDALKKSDIENMDMSLEESLKEYFDAQIEYGMQVVGLTREEVMKEMLSKGESSFEYTNLHASTTYVGVAVSVTLQGYLNSEMTKKEFETGSIGMSDNKLTLELSDIGVDRVTIDIKTTNEDQYCMMVMPTSTWPGLTPQEYLDKIVGSPNLESHLATGDKKGTVKGLSADTEYYVLLFGYSNGTATTELVSETFTTLEEGDPEQLSIKAEFTGIKSDSLTATIIPTPENALYFSTLVEASYTEDDVFDYIDYMAQMYVSFGMAKDRDDFLKQVSVRGSQTITYGKLYSDTEYRVAAVGIYAQTGKYATGVLFSESVRTAPRVVSDATINLVADKYFNGDEVAAEYPQYAMGKGKAVIPVKAEVSGNVQKYFYHIFLNDLSDPASAPDDALIQVLTTQGGVTAPESIFYCEYDKPFTIVGVAKGTDGNYGKVYRKFVTYSKDGCSDISEFVPLQQQKAAAAVSRDFNYGFEMPDIRTSAFMTVVNSVNQASLEQNVISCQEPLWLRSGNAMQLSSESLPRPSEEEIIVLKTK